VTSLILGLGGYGEQLLHSFKWGHAFYSVNAELLDKYLACGDSGEVVKAQNDYLELLDQTAENTRGQ